MGKDPKIATLKSAQKAQRVELVMKKPEFDIVYHALTNCPVDPGRLQVAARLVRNIADHASKESVGQHGAIPTLDPGVVAKTELGRDQAQLLRDAIRSTVQHRPMIMAPTTEAILNQLDDGASSA